VFSDGEARLSDFDVALVEALVIGFLYRNIDRIPVLYITKVNSIDKSSACKLAVVNNGALPWIAQLSDYVLDANPSRARSRR
jgi:hypothetical protein